MQADPVVRVLEALEREGVRYAVFGAVAVNIHGLPGFTEDLDIFVAPERQNVEALKRALRPVFADPDIDQITALYRMKKDTARAKDRMDAEALRRKFHLEGD